MEKFSVCTSVYKNDKQDFVRVALDSILEHQSVKPSEVVLVQDGPVSDEISALLREYEERYTDVMHVIRLEENKGLGNALKLGVENSKYEIIARMDSDDICQSDRFEKQLSFIQENPEVDIVGGQIEEFVESAENIVGKREVPQTDSEIKHYMKSRCPFNHMTVMFRKDAVLRVGNYQPWFWNEDYYLWIRMMIAGCSFANLSDVLVNVRVGAEMYGRRGGWKYFKSEAGIQKLMYDNGIISFLRYVYNVFGRWCIQIAMPNWLRGLVFRTLFRK